MPTIKKMIKKMIPKSIMEIRKNLKQKHEIKREKKIEQEEKQEEYIVFWYSKHGGKAFDFKNPITYTQKTQWLKLYGATPRKTLLADKYAVRDVIKEKLGEEYVIPLIENNGKKYFLDAFDINYDELPNEFVVQCNHGSGMTYVVKDKAKLGRNGFRKIQKKLNRNLKIEFAYCNAFEMVYKDIPPKIFITKYLSSNGDLPDYKFLCFNGKPKYVWEDTNRFTGHRRSVFNLDYTPAGFNLANYPEIEIVTPPTI